METESRDAVRYNAERGIALILGSFRAPSSSASPLVCTYKLLYYQELPPAGCHVLREAFFLHLCEERRRKALPPIFSRPDRQVILVCE